MFSSALFLPENTLKTTQNPYINYHPSFKFCTDRNGINEQNTHSKHKEKDNLRKGWLLFVSDIPALE